MTTITIPLADEQLRKLTELAEASGVTPEEFLRASVEKWLTHSDPAFAHAADYVLRKNAELYRRLA
jgi:hypothetical protein